ncbi:ImmA/IrrE family metallo-endopeptidase [Bosea vestrisii]|uniref:ImmA/IrrE family metallo-endopeptidase n=1 Tax=Bosea vestrisii TaxID=151416 RepID=UPI0024DFF489|nr:ImmA/IrrE family metallo-endopeptidase [Bosea vestrisii]WID95166.1 ImmA/IrrE family metallo-endopeptidase [Bosea vestrisii]
MSVVEARAAARTIIAEFPVRAAPVPVERIVKARGIVLQYAPLADELSGMAYIRDGVRIIGVNALHHPNRQRFTIAHELAHHELHPEQLREEVHLDKAFRVMMRDDVAAQGVDLWEIEANAFAAELLMPHAFLKDVVDPVGLDLDDDERLESLARKFRVSTSALRYRLGVRG